MNLHDEIKMIRAIMEATPSNSTFEKEIAEYYIREITFVKKVWYVITSLILITCLSILYLQ